MDAKTRNADGYAGGSGEPGAPATWSASRLNGCDTVVGENEWLRVEAVPSRGGKIVSLRNKQSGKEWVYRNERPWEPLRYGMDWGEGDRMGWDEMFPTILPCLCPDRPWEHAAYPDHGEVWSLPWQCEIGERGVLMRVHGVQVPYRLDRTCRLEGSDLILLYELTNPTPFPFSYLWAAHFLLDVEPGTRLITEPGLDSVVYYYSHGERLGRMNDRVSYPEASKEDNVVRLDVTEPKLDRVAEKYWFERELTQGCAAVLTPQGERLMYAFSPEEVPYLAVWANYGAFWGEYNFAFEPATGFLDDVSIAKKLGRVQQAEAYATRRWTLTVSIT